MVLAGSEQETLNRLQERVEKAIATIQELRRDRDAWKARAEAAAAQPGDHDTEECDRMKKERSEIRNRIESILSNLESLEATSS